MRLCLAELHPVSRYFGGRVSTKEGSKGSKADVEPGRKLN